MEPNNQQQPNQINDDTDDNAPLQTQPQATVPPNDLSGPPPQANGAAQPRQDQRDGATNKTDVLGIVSLVMIIFVPLLGAVLGYVGMKKAKKEGYSPTLSRIGFWVNLALLALGFLALAGLFVMLMFSGVS